jgi:hypothetical protein
MKLVFCSINEDSNTEARSRDQCCHGKNITCSKCVSVAFFLFFFFSSGPRAYAPDAPQPVGLLCYPSVLDGPTFAASPSPRPCYPERPLAAKGGTAWARIMADNFA